LVSDQGSLVSVRAKLQVSMCSGYDMFHPGYNIQTETHPPSHKQTDSICHHSYRQERRY